MTKMISAALTAVLLFSCASSSVKEKVLDGLVYDETNCPVSNVSVFINGNKAGETDIYGHFCLDAEKLSVDDTIAFRKEEYETVELPLSLSGYPSLLYITVRSLYYLTDRAADLISEGKYSEAEEIIGRLKNMDDDCGIGLNAAVLECMCLYSKGEPEECRKMALMYHEKYGDPIFLEFMEDGE